MGRRTSTMINDIPFTIEHVGFASSLRGVDHVTACWRKSCGISALTFCVSGSIWIGIRPAFVITEITFCFVVWRR
jgi:hypothetical protein